VDDGGAMGRAAVTPASLRGLPRVYMGQSGGQPRGYIWGRAVVRVRAITVVAQCG
jgi:hypothetical protein